MSARKPLKGDSLPRRFCSPRQPAITLVLATAAFASAAGASPAWPAERLGALSQQSFVGKRVEVHPPGPFTTALVLGIRPERPDVMRVRRIVVAPVEGKFAENGRREIVRVYCEACVAGLRKFSSISQYARGPRSEFPVNRTITVSNRSALKVQVENLESPSMGSIRVKTYRMHPRSPTQLTLAEEVCLTPWAPFACPAAWGQGAIGLEVTSSA
jgi:hypothetical protein